MNQGEAPAESEPLRDLLTVDLVALGADLIAASSRYGQYGCVRSTT